LSIPTNEEEQRYNRREIQRAVEFLELEDATVGFTNNRDSNHRIHTPSGRHPSFLDNAHWVVNNVKEDCKYGRIIPADLLFLRYLKYDYQYRDFELSETKSYYGFWLIIMPLLLVISFLFPLAFPDWHSEGSAGGIKFYVHNGISYLLSFISLIGTVGFAIAYCRKVLEYRNFTSDLKDFNEVLSEVSNKVSNKVSTMNICGECQGWRRLVQATFCMSCGKELSTA